MTNYKTPDYTNNMAAKDSGTGPPAGSSKPGINFLSTTDDQQTSPLLCVECVPPTLLDSSQALNYHLQHCHPDINLYRCGHCKVSFAHKTSLLRHIKNLSNQEQESVAGPSSSGVSSCSSSQCLPLASQPVPVAVPLQSFSDLEDTPSQEEDRVVDMDPVETFDMKTDAANFLLALRSSGDITIATVERIQKHVSALLNNVNDHLKSKAATYFKTSNTDVTEEFFREAFDIGNPFDGLETLESQLNYYAEKHGLVLLEEKFLGFRFENRLDRKSKLFLPKQMPNTFQSVSFLQTVKLFMKNKFMRNLIASEVESTDNVYRSYKDGLDFKRNRFLQKYLFALRIILNYDDLEIANGMGSKDVIHKLGCFYFSIQNLPAEESSKLCYIFLLALTYAEDLKTKGAFAKVLKSFKDDLLQLQTDAGVEIELPEGGTYTIRACLVNLSADSLAAHPLCGLLSPSADKFCRSCLVSKADIQQSSTAIGEPRTSRLTERHVREVERKPGLSKQYGVKERSPLCNVMRVPEDCAFDAFHDMVGVIQMDISLVLYEFICVRKLFSAADLNANINSFVYGKPENNNRPSPNFTHERLCNKGYKLKQNGSQTFCLLRIFPFIIRGVKEDDKFLKLIFLLQDVMKTIFSFEIPHREVDNLDNVVFEHNSLFHELFVSPGPAAPTPVVSQIAPETGESEDIELDSEGEEGIAAAAEPEVPRRHRWTSRRLKKGINKLHHLLHYAQQIREKGPLIRLWCARYEGRHRIFTKHAAVQSNFKNPPKTMGNMFQLSTFGAFLNRTGPDPVKFSTFNAMKMPVKNSSYSRQLLEKGFKEEDQIRFIKAAELRGEEYAVGLFVSLKGWAGTRPDFGLILDVIVRGPQSQVFFAVSKSINDGMSPKFNCYQIRNQFETEPLVVTLEDFADYRPIPAWTPVNNSDPKALFLSPRVILMP